ncbi:MARVEL domain-containing protein 2 [Thomomys bottae]
MSSNGGRSKTRDRGYSEVPRDSPYQDGSTLRTLETLHDSELAVSADPLPPPPLPLQPPFGPDFYSSDPEEPAVAPDLKPVRRFVPDSWKNFFRGKKKEPGWEPADSDTRYISDGVECSPPASPGRPPHRAPWVPSDRSRGSEGTLDSGRGAAGRPPRDVYGSLDRPTPTALTYSEKVEAYQLRYAYMKSWAGLLRMLGVAELLLGAGVFACVTAYIHKDSEWYNLFGYSQPYGGLGGLGSLGSTYGGYYYGGPKTPFVLVVAGLAWVATLIVLVLGMSMYYRTILLDSSWWPLTEFGINVALFILYMAAAIVYVNDTNRGGLCYYPLFNTPMNAVFCRVEGGQIAAMIFLFVTMIVYLVSALVCLKLWRHEAARRHRECLEQQEISEASLPSKRKLCEVATSDRQRDPEGNFTELRTTKMKQELLSGHIPPGHIPKPVVMPDYVAKYPAIHTDDDRERYKAVFQDQFSEYKELSAEVQAVLRKLDELDTVMHRLPHHSENRQEHERISRIHEEFNRKKHDPSFLEKKERCDYLKNKLSHIKQRIQEYDKVMNWDIQGYS